MAMPPTDGLTAVVRAAIEDARVAAILAAAHAPTEPTSFGSAKVMLGSPRSAVAQALPLLGAAHPFAVGYVVSEATHRVRDGGLLSTAARAAKAALAVPQARFPHEHW